MPNKSQINEYSNSLEMNPQQTIRVYNFVCWWNEKVCSYTMNPSLPFCYSSQSGTQYVGEILNILTHCSYFFVTFIHNVINL